MSSRSLWPVRAGTALLAVLAGIGAFAVPGTDVVALQHLLAAHGQSVSVDGVFGSGARSAVVSFQQSKGLTADGIVGPATWGALAITVRQGDNGPAVKAVQSLLNAKRGAGLSVDGAFGPATHTAVRTFQSHDGIGGDGIAGPTTWKNLLWHYESIDFGTGTMCAQSPDGNANAHWATAGAVGQLEAAAATFAGTGNGNGNGNGRLPVGDASFEHGGDMPGHASQSRDGHRRVADPHPLEFWAAPCGTWPDRGRRSATPLTASGTAPAPASTTPGSHGAPGSRHASPCPPAFYCAVFRASALFPIELCTLKLTASDR